MQLHHSPVERSSVSSFIKGITGDFPGGPVLKNPPYNAGGEALIPGQGTKIPHATEQLDPHVATTELLHHSEDTTCYN